jgi:hypothetical protein
VLHAALLASLVAGLTGLALVFGRGLFEDPAKAFIAAGFVYAAIPGVATCLALTRFRRKVQAGTGSDLVVFVSLGAVAAVVWLLPFLGLFVPIDGTATLALTASARIALCHALAGGLGGLVFWVLTRQGRQT